MAKVRAVRTKGRHQEGENGALGRILREMDAEHGWLSLGIRTAVKTLNGGQVRAKKVSGKGGPSVTRYADMNLENERHKPTVVVGRDIVVSLSLVRAVVEMWTGRPMNSQRHGNAAFKCRERDARTELVQAMKVTGEGASAVVESLKGPRSQSLSEL